MGQAISANCAFGDGEGVKVGLAVKSTVGEGVGVNPGVFVGVLVGVAVGKRGVGDAPNNTNWISGLLLTATMPTVAIITKKVAIAAPICERKIQISRSPARFFSFLTQLIFFGGTFCSS
ncbi:MAG: hypothetical protein CUN52_09775 [Phototrophicales bacterium]|nr:MAG: hypothetical protein CUN52_09775 [Phototrophicales bacterium]